MVAIMSRNRICMEPRRQLNIHPRGFIFFSFEVEGGAVRRWNFLFIVLSLCSHM